LPACALEHPERAEAIRAAAGENAGWEVALALIEHGRALRPLGRAGEAIPRWREAAAILVSAFGASDPRVVEVRRLMGL
jgi:hypothetical protein